MDLKSNNELDGQLYKYWPTISKLKDILSHVDEFTNLLNIEAQDLSLLIHQLAESEEPWLKQLGCYLFLFSSVDKKPSTYDSFLMVEDAKVFLLNFWRLQLGIGNVQSFHSKESNSKLELLIRQALDDAYDLEPSNEMRLPENLILGLPLTEMYTRASKVLVRDIIRYYKHFIRARANANIPNFVLENKWIAFFSDDHEEAQEWIMLLPKSEVFLQLAYQVKDSVNHISAGFNLLTSNIGNTLDLKRAGSIITLLPQLKSTESLVMQIMYLATSLSYSLRPQITAETVNLSFFSNIDEEDQIIVTELFLKSCLDIFSQFYNSISDLKMALPELFDSASTDNSDGSQFVLIGHKKLATCIEIGGKFIVLRGTIAPANLIP
jgi:hypothetical protein